VRDSILATVWARVKPNRVSALGAHPNPDRAPSGLSGRPHPWREPRSRRARGGRDGSKRAT